MPIAWFGPMPSNGAFQNYSSVAYRDQPGVAMPALLGNLPVTHWANDRDVERASRRNAARVAELVKVGDRLFRAASLKRAEDRYQEAARIDSGQALPYVRLAQVAVKRGQYAEAVNQLRQAQTADPEWAKNGAAHDVQNLFGEPAEFAAELAKLETNLQANPSDRDLWLVLGTELFLTGRTQRALDVFVRLTDREPDALLGSLIESCQLLLENH
jgi:tetratricopeptide (TPR) repeat protein